MNKKALACNSPLRLILSKLKVTLPPISLNATINNNQKINPKN
jgi:hypothetical protein